MIVFSLIQILLSIVSKATYYMGKLTVGLLSVFLFYWLKREQVCEEITKKKSEFNIFLPASIAEIKDNRLKSEGSDNDWHGLKFSRPTRRQEKTELYDSKIESLSPHRDLLDPTILETIEIWVLRFGKTSLRRTERP